MSNYRYGVARAHDDGGAEVRISIPGDLGTVWYSWGHPVTERVNAGETVWFRRLEAAGSEIEGPVTVTAEELESAGWILD